MTKWYFGTLLVAAVVVDLASGDNSGWRNRRNLQFFDNHDHGQMMALKNLPQEINVDPKLTYNKKFMALMNSPCRPEVDGYFGATSGDPIRLQYAFQMEVEPLSQVMKLLDVIEDRTVDSILMNTFPQTCGLRRRLGLSDKLMEVHERDLAHEDGHPSGFRFFPFEEVAKCEPEVDVVNFCSVLSGSVFIYGRHQQGEAAALSVLSYIEKVLNTADPKTIHSELAAIKSVVEYSMVSGGMGASSFVDDHPQSHNSSSSGGVELSRVGILLVTIGCLVFIAICYYIYIRWKEHKATDALLRKRGIFQKGKFNGFDPDLRSIGPISIEEKDHDDDDDDDDGDSYDSGMGGLESFVDEEDRVDRDSRRTYRSRDSAASRRRREELERLRVKSGLPTTNSQSMVSTHSEGLDFGPYHDDASTSMRSAIV